MHNKFASTKQQCEHLAVLCFLLPALPSAVTNQYGRMILKLLLRELENDSGGLVVLESLGHLAKHCSPIWSAATMNQAVNHLRLLARVTDSSITQPVLSCLGALMTLPASLPLQNQVIHQAFSDYLFSNIDFAPGIKENAMKIVGAVGTADRNPRSTRVSG